MILLKKKKKKIETSFHPPPDMFTQTHRVQLQLIILVKGIDFFLQLLLCLSSEILLSTKLYIYIYIYICDYAIQTYIIEIKMKLQNVK